MKAAIAGGAYRIERQFAAGMEPVIRQIVRAALETSRLSLADIEMVVTVASDTLDGMMVPVRAELAGALGKNYLNVPSSAGHALSAAAAAIEAGDAKSVLVVGWGAASKLAHADGRANQFDPFYMRPVGATPELIAALQERVLASSGVLTEDDIASFEARMANIAREDAQGDALGAHGFCDGVAAIVLRRAADETSGAIIADHATASRSHNPLDGSFDPAGWVREALTGFASARPKKQLSQGFIEVSGPTSWAELRGIAGAVEAGYVDCSAASANSTGGGAAAWFGPATGIRALARLHGRMDRTTPDRGLFVDLAGPLGQHVTGMLIERSGA